MASLAKLPSEILELISTNISSVSAHLAFSQTCHSTRAVYTNAFWQKSLARIGYGRSLIHKDVKWSFMPVMLAYHTENCVVCNEVDAKHSYL